MKDIDNTGLVTEGDVETRIIMPLLTNKSPEGLGYELEDIQSKVNLKRFVIDKGSKTKTYYPDFILNIDGVPSVVIEAKKPGEDLYEAIRQASLYATEINKLYQNNFNPCKYIIATDGNGLLAGYCKIEYNAKSIL